MSSSFTGGQPQSRFQELLGSIPLVTLSITLICVVAFVASNLTDFNEATNAFKLSPYMIVYYGELYRIVTAAYMHGGMLHIAMNMMSLVSLGQSLEPLFGSLRFFFLMLLYTLVIGCAYVASAFAWAGISVAIWGPTYGKGYPEPVLLQGAVGFSGVLFAMAVDETSLSPFPTRSVFGLFNVPTKLYPWILMAVIQFVIPGVSLLGHLMGIVVGVLHSAGALDWALPTMVTLRKAEASPCMRPIMRSRPYRLTPQQEVLRSSEHGLRATAGMLGGAVATVFRPLTDCVRARFGRGGVATAAAGAVGGGAAPAQRRVDDSGRLVAAGPPAAAAPAADAGDDLMPGQGGGLWGGAAGAVLAGGSGGGSGGQYVRVASDEDAPAGLQGHGPGAVHGAGATAGAGAAPQQQAAPLDPVKAAAREKAARAAEARLAAAAATGRPGGAAPGTPGGS